MFTRFSPAVSSASCLGVKSVRLPSLPSWPSYQVANSSRAVASGMATSRVARWALPINRSLISARRSQSRQNGDIMPLDVRVLRPGKQPHQPRALSGRPSGSARPKGTRYCA